MARRKTTRNWNTRNWNTRKIALAAALLLPMLGLGGWFAIASDNAGRLKPILGEYGYTALTPPSRFFGPGTFVMVEPRNDGTLTLHLACKMDNAALAALWQRSGTLDQSFVTKVKNSFEASAEALQLVKSSAKGSRAEDMDVSLREISIVTMPYESLLGVRTQYLRDACETAIIWNLRAGASVCQTEEALEADIQYSAKSQDEIGAGGGLQLPEQAGGSFQTGRQASRENQAEGNDLILGVRVRTSNCFFLEKAGKHIAKIGL
jgi:hypothetical protein